MIQKLKKHLLFTLMLFVSVILILFIAAINLIPARQSREAAFEMLTQVADSRRPDLGPRFSDKTDRQTDSGNSTLSEAAPETPDSDSVMPPADASKEDPLATFHHLPASARKNPFASSNFSIIATDSDGTIQFSDFDRSDLIDEASLTDTISSILSTNKTFGLYQHQYFLRRDTDTGYLFVLMDSSAVFLSSQRILIWSIAAGVIVWILCLILFYLLLGKLTSPLSLALEKQRQFISDAEHELKTPISVIASNADVLQAEIGDNKWLSYIQQESEHMGNLVRDLMTLSVIDSEENLAPLEVICLSDLVLSAALPFESIAFEHQIEYEIQVTPDLFCMGNEEELKRLLIILTSNAVKYGKENGVIRVTLKEEKKQLFLSVYNSGEGIPAHEQEKIFERFYRVDKARSRKQGGHGLGLSIARSIAEHHHAKISVTGQSGEWIQFTVTLHAHAKQQPNP